jgi:signal transduction histidine kinase
LGLRVLGAYLAGVALSVLLVAMSLFAMLKFRAEVLDWRVADQARTLAQRVTFDELGNPAGFLPSDAGVDWIYESLKEELAYRLLDSSGRTVLVSPAGEQFWNPDSTAIPLHSGRFTFERDGSIIHVATDRLKHGERTWFLQYAGSERLADLMQVEFGLPLVWQAILLFSLVLLAVFGACSYVTLRRTFRPLREISTAATLISLQSLHARLPAHSAPREVEPLVESFNRTLDRLEHGYRIQKEFLAAAAHELKTPLALIRAEIELSPESAERDTLLQDIEHMTRQVQQLLVLAEVSEVQNYRLESVDAVEVATEAVAYLQRMALAADVRLELHSGLVPSNWLADRAALFTLLKNLLENAIQHSPAGAVVIIEVDVARISVRDFGPGADNEQLSQLFVRFWRGAHRRDEGAGLGLSICHEIAEAHRWSLSAHRADPGLSLVLTKGNAEGLVGTSELRR